MFAFLISDENHLTPMSATPYYACNTMCIASSPGHSQILSRSHEEKSGEGLGAKLRHGVTDRKWWTRLVRNMDSVCTTKSTISGP